MNYTIIETQESFNEAINIIKKSNIIGIDTEFLRTNTYFPLLSLIQISTQDDYYFLFDIHSKDIDWFHLLSILINPEVIKIIHSAEQDLEAIEYRFNTKISNIIDTQIMAELIEIDRQCGYGTLVEYFFNIKIDKDKQFSAWNKRPLTKTQLDYAAMDVVYLIKLYNLMLQKLCEKKIDIQVLIDRSASISYKTKTIDKSNLIRLVKIFCNKNPISNMDKDLTFQLIKLREELAIKHNKARKYIIEDNDLAKIIDSKLIVNVSLTRYITTEVISQIIHDYS